MTKLKRGNERAGEEDRNRMSTRPTFSRSAQKPRATLAVLLLFSSPVFSSSHSTSLPPRANVRLQQDSAVPTETEETGLPWQPWIAC